MHATRLISFAILAAAIAVAGCGDDSSGTGGSGAMGGDGGSGGSAATGGSGGSAGTGGSGGSGGTSSCVDDVGDRPSLTAQPTIMPATVNPGGDIMVEIPVSAQTRFVIVTALDGFEVIGENQATTTGSETIAITIPIDAGAGTFPNAWVQITLCVDENTCTGPGQTNVSYLPDVNDDSRYDVRVFDNGTQQEIKLSCYDVLQFRVVAP